MAEWSNASACKALKSSVRIRFLIPKKTVSPALRRLSSRRDKTSVRSLRLAMRPPSGPQSGRVKDCSGVLPARRWYGQGNNSHRGSWERVADA